MTKSLTSNEHGLPSEVVDICNAARIPISVADAQAKDQPLTYVNPAFERLTGWQGGEAIGQNCRFLQGPLTNTALTRDIGARCNAHQETSVCLVNYRKDKTIFYNVIALHPLQLPNGRHVVLGCQFEYKPTFNLGCHKDNANNIHELWGRFRDKQRDACRINREADLYRLDAVSMRFNAASMLIRNRILALSTPYLAKLQHV